MAGAPGGGQRSLVLGALFVFMLENIWFPASTKSTGCWSSPPGTGAGRTRSRILIKFAANQMNRPVDRSVVLQFSLPVPDWVYPSGAASPRCSCWCWPAAWSATGGRRRPWPRRTSASAPPIWPLLVVFDFPPSAVPFFLIAAAVCVDLAFVLRQPVVRAVLGAVLVTAAVYGGLIAQDRLLDAPPFLLASAPVTAVLLGAAWYGAEWFARRRSGEPETAGSVPFSAPATP